MLSLEQIDRIDCRMELFQRSNNRVVLGMIHLPPLPGTPYYEANNFGEILQFAVNSACVLDNCGADGCLVQTVDRVYPADDSMDPARVSAVSVVVHEISRATSEDFSIGVQIMKNSSIGSLGVAKVAGGSFIRATAMIGTTHDDSGTVSGDPYQFMSYRKYIDALDIFVFADIATIHFNSGRPVKDLARNAARVGVDALVLGHADEQRNQDMVDAAKSANSDLPIFLSGHTDHDNVSPRLDCVDGVFVGTCLEQNGWGTAIDESRVVAYMKQINTLPPRK